MEPTAKLNYHGTPGQVGHGYDWSGELVGAGKMQLSSVAPGLLEMDLDFVKPFKSHAKVNFELMSTGDNQTEVTWHMDGKLPFFLFFMLKMMKTFIGMDYERGLKMLKEYVEHGTVKSATQIEGVVEVPRIDFIGVEDRCTMETIGDSMKQTMPRAFQLATENGLKISGPPGSLYNDINLKTQACLYTAFIPVASSTQIEGAIRGSITAGRAIKVIHTGSYENLSNAWSTAMSYQRNKKLKTSKSQPAFELYINDPTETPEESLVTEVYVPLK